MSILIDKVSEFVAEHNSPIYSFSAISEAFGQETVRFVPGNRCQNTYSVSKAFVVTAVGLAVDAGVLSLDDKVTDILAEYLPDGIDGRWYGVTVRDAMQHRLGLPHGYLDIDVKSCREFGTDFLAAVFKEPFICDPCTVYEYTDAAYYLTARVVEKVMGCPVDNLLWEKLFTPMNYLEAAWCRCPQGHPMGATGLFIAAEDMVKLGELYRCGGVWNGQRIISEDWVNTVLTEHHELRPRTSIHAYGKGGMRGQDLCVFPEKKLSIGWTAYNFKDKDALLELIYNTEF